VVHGRNDEIKETVARFLGQLDLTPVILHEQPSGGRTVIEKFEDHSDASFAVVLLTPDDVGRLGADASAELQSRARQNVIFEWGFFVAKLGRRHVCALYAEGVELPSDVNGVIYVELDLKGAWKLLLARELKAADLAVDLNRAI
jgi:predicted nucleotide-binding protein